MHRMTVCCLQEKEWIIGEGEVLCVCVCVYVFVRGTALVVDLTQICHRCNFPHTSLTLPSSVSTHLHSLVSDRDQNTHVIYMFTCVRW